MLNYRVEPLNARAGDWLPLIILVAPACVAFAIIIRLRSFFFIDSETYISLFDYLIWSYLVFSDFEDSRTVPVTFWVQTINQIVCFKFVPPLNIVCEGSFWSYFIWLAGNFDNFVWGQEITVKQNLEVTIVVELRNMASLPTMDYLWLVWFRFDAVKPISHFETCSPFLFFMDPNLLSTWFPIACILARRLLKNYKL